MSGDLCPHPEKQRHRSRAAANKAMARLEANEGIDLALRPYRCVCGTWHLGHHSKALTFEKWDRKMRRRARRNR